MGGPGLGQDREAMVRDYLRSREGCLLVAPLLISDADPDPVVSEPFWSDVDPTKKVM